MSDSGYNRRDLTFEQAAGLQEMPRQLKLDELPQSVKARLWQVFDKLVTKGTYNEKLTGPFREVALKHFVEREDGFSDRFDRSAFQNRKRWRPYFDVGAKYFATLGFIEWMIRECKDSEFTSDIALVLEKERCAYRVFENWSIVPFASELEAKVFESAAAALKAHDFGGARKHLIDAASDISSGRYAESVRNSVHALESLVRHTTGENKFAKAVEKINKHKVMHGALKEALGNLYGYSSDEQGIRHPLLDQGDANVSEADAIFMIGVCASFVTYLLSY